MNWARRRVQKKESTFNYIRKKKKSPLKDRAQSTSSTVFVNRQDTYAVKCLEKKTSNDASK